MARKAFEGPFTAGDIEHLGAIGMGLALVTVGMRRPKNWLGVATSVMGGLLVARGLQGYRRVYEITGRQMPQKPITLPKRATKVEYTINIRRPAAEIYGFWRNLENLPKVMSHLITVQPRENGHTRWVAKAIAGTVVEWDAEIINDIPNELIAWRSFEGSDVDNAGSVHFTPREDGSTDVHLVIRYTPPADVLGDKVAKLMGFNPQGQIEEDLNAFKENIEAGALAG